MDESDGSHLHATDEIDLEEAPVNRYGSRIASKVTRNSGNVAGSSIEYCLIILWHKLAKHRREIISSCNYTKSGAKRLQKHSSN